MRRRQFLKGIGAVTVAALVPPSEDMTLQGWDKTDEWHHIAVTRESDVIIGYIDGVKVGDYMTVIDCEGKTLMEVYDATQKELRMRPV